MSELPDWLPDWCREHVGGEPAGVLFQTRQVSMVFGLRLAGGEQVVVKARADGGRAVSCVAAQARLAARGFACARPLTSVVRAGELSVHAEEYRPGGEVLRGDSPEIAVARRCGRRPPIACDGRARRGGRATARRAASSRTALVPPLPCEVWRAGVNWRGSATAPPLSQPRRRRRTR